MLFNITCTAKIELLTNPSIFKAANLHREHWVVCHCVDKWIFMMARTITISISFHRDSGLNYSTREAPQSLWTVKHVIDEEDGLLQSNHSWETAKSAWVFKTEQFIFKCQLLNINTQYPLKFIRFWKLFAFLSLKYPASLHYRYLLQIQNQPCRFYTISTRQCFRVQQKLCTQAANGCKFTESLIYNFGKMMQIWNVT